jgi:hypothetical protein
LRAINWSPIWSRTKARVSDYARVSGCNTTGQSGRRNTNPVDNNTQSHDDDGTVHTYWPASVVLLGNEQKASTAARKRPSVSSSSLLPGEL